jgi:hypothetical protein
VSGQPLFVRLCRVGFENTEQYVVDLIEASKVVQATISREGIGVSATLRGFGDVIQRVEGADRIVARVSYNGRVWSPFGALFMERAQ